MLFPKKRLQLRGVINISELRWPYGAGMPGYRERPHHNCAQRERRKTALHSSFARIFRNGRCRSSFGVAGRRPLLWSFGLERQRRTPDPFGDAMAVIAQLAHEFLQCTFRRLYPVRRTGVIDAGRHHRDADDAIQAFVEGGADDDVGVRIGLFADASSGFVDLE